MNRLWVRLSLAFTIVFLLSAFVLSVVFELDERNDSETVPPEVTAYFEELRAERFFPSPTIALGIVAGIAIVSGIILSRTLAAPMSDLETAAAEIGRGDLSKRVDPRGSQEMIAVAAAFNDMASQLEESETLRRSLLADVAHELRHPLHVLQGNLQAMQDGVYPVNEEEIDRLITQTHHMTVMVDDLHILAQAEARRLPLAVQNVDIAELVKDVAATYQQLAVTRDIDLHVELLGTMPESMTIDRARLRQAVQNLLENALRHAPDGGRITLSVQQTDENLIIEVADNGEGIAADRIASIFDRLYRGDTSRQRASGDNSTGLGLPISQAIIDAHGGSLTARSPGIGQGSTFTITLPLETA